RKSAPARRAAPARTALPQRQGCAQVRPARSARRRAARLFCTGAWPWLRDRSAASVDRADLRQQRACRRSGRETPPTGAGRPELPGERAFSAAGACAMSEAPSNPNACVEDEAPCDSHTQSCPGVRPESQALKSINIDVGWTFSGAVTGGEYELVLNGQEFRGLLNGGAIRIDQLMSSVAGSGRLSIAFPNGLIYSTDVELGMTTIDT